jgi:hypothetical protein
MRPFLFFALAIALLLIACDQRPPVAAFDARAAAENLCLRERLLWGDAVEQLAPATPDSDGRSTWQVRFAPAADGTHRLVLVDAATGWARQPPPGYVPRRAAIVAGAQVQPGVVRDGIAILIIAEPQAGLDAAAIGRLTREAARLNDLASRTGLWPLFSVHTDQAGRVGLVYGWQGDRGIERDEDIAAWMRTRAGIATPRWVDLGR